MFYPLQLWVSSAIAPISAVLFALLCVPVMAGWSEDYWPLFQQLPYMMAGVLITLAQVFNQGRLANLAILFTAAYGFIQNVLGGAGQVAQHYEVYYWFSVLLPANLVLIRLLPDRRPLSLAGLSYPLLLLLQATLLNQLPALLEPFAALQNLWASDIRWQSDFPPGLQHFLQQGHLGLIPLISLSLSMFLAALLIRPPWNNDLAMLALSLMYGVLFYNFSTPYISVLITVTAMALLFVTLLINNHRLAFKDELTELPARRALMNDLSHRIGSYCLVMADVDHFKQFNDSYGHDVGDDVLRVVARQLSKAGGRGKAYRYGGEEFTLIFPLADDVRCQDFVEELRERIAAYPLVMRNKKNRPASHEQGEKQRKNNTKNGAALHVTMSFGVAQKRRGETIEQLFKRADDALYEAKKRGRNRVQLASR